MKLIYLSLTWIAGIYLGDKAALFWLVTSGLAAIVLLAIMLRRAPAFLAVLCLIAFLGGALRLQLAPGNEGTVRSYNDRGAVTVKGTVVDDPEPDKGAISFRISAREIEQDGKWNEVSGSVLVYTRPSPSSQKDMDYPYYRYGDLLEINGELEAPQRSDDLRYEKYLESRGIYSTIYYPKVIKLLDSGQGLKPKEWLYSLRDRLSRSLDNAMAGNGNVAQSSAAHAVAMVRRLIRGMDARHIRK